MNNYEVHIKCGHVGKGKYVEKTVVVKAESAKEAALIARWLPRVKHHHKDAIFSVKRISIQRAKEINEINRQDPYFKCECVQDQRMYQEDIKIEKQEDIKLFRREENKKVYYYGKEKLKNPKKYMTRYYFEGEAV